MNLAALKENKVAQATVIIAVFTLLAKILGVIREGIFAHEFGLGQIVGVYFAAFRIPDFIYGLLILGTFSVAFIPVFSEYMLKDRKRADSLASSIINTTVLMMVGLTLAAYFFINPLVHAIAPGFNDQDFEATKSLTKIILLSPLFFTLSAITSSILNTYKRFLLMSLSPIIYNISIIFGVLVLYPRFGGVGLAWGVVLGAFIQFIIQLPQVFRLGFRYSFGVVRADDGFVKFWKLYFPRIFSMGTEQISNLIITIFGSFLGTAALANYYYANNLQSFVLGIFAVSFAIAVFPLLSDLFNNKNIQEFKNVLAKTIIQILFFVIPASILILVLRAQIVRLILGAGSGTNFDFEATRIVAQSLGLFSISLFAQSLVPLFNRTFYAMQNTVIPVTIGLITVCTNILLAFYLIPKFGIAGMALSFSITSIINLIILIMQLHYKLGSIHDEYLIVNSLKIIIASTLAGAATFVSLYMVAPFVNMHTYLGVLIQAATAGFVGVGVYLGMGWILGLSESHDLVKLARSTANKIGRPFNIIFNRWS